MSTRFYLPSKIATYLRRLEVEYASGGKVVLAEVIKHGRVFVREGDAYDNWNGGTHGHAVLFFLSPETLGKLPLDNQDEYLRIILDHLNKCAESVESEFFSGVFFEFEDENDPEYQQAISISGRVPINTEALSIWKPGHIRLFVSHRDAHKAEARALAEALHDYGISAFVVHDTIEPMSTWQAEIIKGLETMEIMLAFVTDDFHESIWTNQEVGFALGRNIPVVSLKLEKKDPGGFIGSQQALRGSLRKPAASVPGIYKLLAEKLGNKKRLQGGLITAFVSSTDFNEAIVRFDRMAAVVQSMSDEELSQIVIGFAENDQLHNSIYLTNNNQRLCRFLKQTTGVRYAIRGKALLVEKELAHEEVPF